MSDPTVFPRSGKILRLVITHTGYRPYIKSRGLDKNLDDVANEACSGGKVRPYFELLHHVKEAWVNALSSDCGASWGELADSAWGKFQGAFQHLVRELDISALRHDAACKRVYQLVFVPELSGLLRRVCKELPGIDVERWWSSPFASWVNYVAGLTQQPESLIRDQLEGHLGVDARSIERWVSGDAIGTSLWPYRDTALAAVGKEVWESLSDRERDRITGWLMLAITVQSIAAGYRDAIRRDFSLHNQRRLRSVDEVVELLKRETFDINGLSARKYVGQIIDALNELFANFGKNKSELAKFIKLFEHTLDAMPPMERIRFQFYCDLFSARYQANIREEAKAIGLYEKAVNGAWWYAGPRQHAVLHEALIYAVGIGDKVKAEHFWDKCYLLGLNRAPKKALDVQELRRISFEFERMFRPLKAKHRVPPQMEVIFADKPFSLSAKDLKNPNQKKAFAEGRTRRTPLMRAVMEGALSDVIQALEAGGDPNDYIKESGEGPFIYALRRAYDRKDPVILEHFLTLPLNQETLNRSASTKRETPLKFALEMGDASVVQRLIELGADLEQECFHAESALCYAMFLLHDAIYGDRSESRAQYLLGLTPGDGSDAKGGAILDSELAARRQAIHASIDEPWKKNLYEAVRAHFTVSPDAMKAVIKVLLSNGADPNHCYSVPRFPRDQWTPTLYAAQLGDVEVFKEMLAAGGDPGHALHGGSVLDRKDAMWIAIAHGQHAIVNHLQQLNLRRQ